MVKIIKEKYFPGDKPPSDDGPWEISFPVLNPEWTKPSEGTPDAEMVQGEPERPSATAPADDETAQSGSV